MIILAWFDLIDQNLLNHIVWRIQDEFSLSRIFSLKYSLSWLILSLKKKRLVNEEIFFNKSDLILMKNPDLWLSDSVLAPTLIRPWIFRFDHPWFRSSHDLIWSCWFHQLRYWINRNVGLCHLINSNCTSWILSPLIFSLYLILWNRWRNLDPITSNPIWSDSQTLDRLGPN